MKRCHKCGTEWVSEKRQPGFRDTCPQCTAYLHCCLNCRFHDPHAHNQCYIPNTEWVGDRRGGNFCEEFEFRDAVINGEIPEKKQEQARKVLEGLFGEDVVSSRKPKSLDDLFKK
jgi:hypothetical protein